MQNTKAYIMLVCATLFWAGNFMVGKYAFMVEIPPLTLVFYRWLLVWIILLPFTFKEIIKYKDTILNNLPLLFFDSTSLLLYIFVFRKNLISFSEILTLSEKSTIKKFVL